jgi:hypothetical protein
MAISAGIDRAALLGMREPMEPGAPPALEPRVPRESARGRALEAWARSMDDAAAAEATLAAMRERVRVARVSSADRARRGYDALAAGQEVFARGLLDAAHAHERLAWEGEAQVAEGERRCAALRARCDELDAEVRSEAERVSAQAGVRTSPVRSGGGRGP